jgi:hypothetical protein
MCPARARVLAGQAFTIFFRSCRFKEFVVKIVDLARQMIELSGFNLKTAVETGF